ncbi:hypothetical protein ACIQVU_19360 [Lysinibacillus sp. NPDC098008]|uniref:hypothetical protein n=1 Tax=Lysinibacillus sp. NPDC098008 TaxID=3364146 RepID=UPI003822B793
MGTQIYKGTGRKVLVVKNIKSYIQEFCDKQPNKEKSVLEKEDGTYMSFIEANQIVEAAADELNLKGITITSFRKTFGHKLCPLLDTRILALDATGFKTNSQTNLHTMFDLKKGGWE